ncbi:MoaD/ThiS family protein [Gilvimarinus polysaccharolyticus]|uniref:MoaD/ThiS family protein n=1 Tax=Gilvimarinus polysaccharolyticus TaxID=863921 RepID=UPI000A9E162E|nr:MoaD/ThiS family protein [Gilvimarinus polysaccharolyticus]
MQVLFFAQLRELLGCESIELSAQAVSVAGDVVPALVAECPQWAEVLQGKAWLMSVNQTMAKANTAIKVGDEVALFPPVTGG